MMTVLAFSIISILYSGSAFAAVASPSVTITSPYNGAEVRIGTVKITGTAYSANAITKVDVKMDANYNSYKIAAPTGPGGSWATWTLDYNIPSGTHTLTARVTDSAGKQSWYPVTLLATNDPEPHPEPGDGYYDDFVGPTYKLPNKSLSPNGRWYAWSSGSTAMPGSQGVKAISSGNAFYQNNPSATSGTQSFSSLTLSTQSYSDFHLNLDVRTVAQTRLNTTPKVWETAWLFFHAAGSGQDDFDRSHYYYFLVKTNGAQIGKYDGATQGQVILANKYYPNGPRTVMGQWQNWDITVSGDHIVVKVNGVTTFDINNAASFTSGRIGLYSENSKVEFRNVVFEPT
jgi:hypothetical protein